ncbi:COX15/CtaA family protein [Sphingomonas glaciei]|uniref:Heme A synthase n=1 Tax=Sphingomonas glaciei TaxID=2938948 RepID=A0ABY5MXJ9_9SPHN|nr:COX15/CtaA family protein [Sphingomonas glaciei]UUR08721.1 COX15/CtaA family protein [Sphingomonas glaciei]
MTDAALPRPTARPLAVSNWLLTLCGLIIVMVVVGGITRLTESGLSITEWKPISGAIPPVTEAQWLREFELYKRIPEYQQINRGMSLADFKNIFFWEWVHRQLGRVIGLAALLPLVWFAAKKAIPAGYGWRTGSIFLLVCVQGAIGWWMVASGLTERTDVSHVRLAVHLLTALFIFGWALWTALDLRSAGARPRRVPTLGLWAFAALLLQLLFGAYVAGLDAGYAFNSWPLMGDELYPSAAPWLEPFLRNFVDNPITVQFIHRWWAFVVLVFAVVLARRLRGVSRRHSIFLHSAIGLQILLGIWTLLSGVSLHVAAAHQATAVLVVASFVAGVHRLARVGASASTSLGTSGTEERDYTPLVPSEAEGR